MEINVKIFTDFFINCEMNIWLSLLMSKEHTYQVLSYVNGYKYYVNDAYGWCKAIDVFKQTLNDELSSVIECNYLDVSKDDLVDIIKSNVDSQQIIGVAVDLYNWLPNGIAYRKEHWYHYTTVVGYDEDSIYVIDDDMYGYGKKKVSYNTLLNAFTPNTLEAGLVKYLIKEHLQEQNIRLDVICENAEKILPQLDQFITSDMWAISLGNSYDPTCYLITCVNRILNCQIGNGFLLKTLLANDMISNECYVQLSDYNERTVECWKRIHNALIKKFLSNSKANFKSINEMSREAFMCEKAMWELLIENR